MLIRAQDGLKETFGKGGTKMVTTNNANGTIDIDYFNKLSKDWRDYEESIKEQLQMAMNNQRSMYDELSQRWADSSKNLRSQIMDSVKSGNEGSEELYTFLRNYQNKLNARIFKASEFETSEYNNMLERWIDEAQKVDGLLFRLERTEGDKKNDPTLVELYSSWVDLSNDMTLQFAKALREGNGEYDKLAVTWKEFLDGTQEILMKLPRTNPTYENLLSTWKEVTYRMGGDLSLIIKEGNSNLEHIRKNWAEASAKMREEMLVLFKDNDYEELYKGFFERAAPLMGPNWPLVVAQNEYNQMQQDLDDLKKTINALEREIRLDEK